MCQTTSTESTKTGAPAIGSSVEELSFFCCPNSECIDFRRFGSGNLGVREWIGKAKHIRRLYCRTCGQRFSERRGSLMEYGHLPQEKVVTIVKCLRHGNNVDATADIAGVDPRTVQRIVERAGPRGEAFHNQKVTGVETSAVQIDEMHGKAGQKGPRNAAWIFTAIAVSSRLMLDLMVGRRDAEHADRFVARVASRLGGALPLFCIDNWKPYYGAFLRIAHRVIHRRRRSRSQPGRRPQPVVGPREDLRVAVVSKIRDAKGKLLKVKRFALYGTLRSVKALLSLAHGIGRVINTAFIERLHGTLRGQTARLFRRTRAGSAREDLLEKHLFLWRDCYNWTTPHGSLKSRTPAMAAGLADHVWSVLEYVLYPVHRCPLEEADRQERIKELLECPLDPRKRAAG